MSEPEEHKGKPLAVDRHAASASPTEPAFVGRPNGAPVYHGFRVLEDVTVEGFTFGAITDFETEPCEAGDAFVVAPDGSRAGLVWEVGAARDIEQVLPLEPERWGVWAVWFPHPMRTHADARNNLATVVPDLKARWQEWKTSLSHLPR